MLGTQNVEELANQAAGNWRHFESFSWWGRDDDLVPDPTNWMIWNFESRDDRLVDQSNAAAIHAMLAPYKEGDRPDVIDHGAGHWACGWVGGVAVRVFREDGTVTEAFRACVDIKELLESYALLDESDYSNREYEATLANIREEGRRIEHPEGHDKNKGWEAAVFSWLWDHNQRALENRDDQGGYPSEAEITEALIGIGWLPDPEDYPTEGVDLVTLDGMSFFIAGFEDRGFEFWVRPGEDWRAYARRYLEDDPETRFWRVTGPGLTDCELLDPEG